jgi:signal transduction histidine kinase
MRTNPSYVARASRALTVVVFVAIAGVLIWDYRITRAWQRTIADRVALQNEETADLMIKAIARDMRGVQSMILASRDWDALPLMGSSLDLIAQVATTFARYPYPESFFTWRGGTDGMVFFSRATRPPQWMAPPSQLPNFPITVAVDPPVASEVRQRLRPSIAAQSRYTGFEVNVAGVPYQVIARISYADPVREHVESVSGFTVNLDWVRQRYFADILAEVQPSASGGLTQDVALLDEHDRAVVGSNISGSPIAERSFPLLFMDSSDTVSDLPQDLTRPRWTLRVSASQDPMLLSALERADATLAATGIAVLLCGVSLLLAQRAVLSGVKLAETRSRFVSSVTHELKTPLANIRALAGTLMRDSPGSVERFKAYPPLLVQEANSLGRLVDNILAYARVSDITETYSFEPMAAAELVDEALKSFLPRLGEQATSIQVEASQDMPFVRADQRAIVLALVNLIENALRHARTHVDVGISTRKADATVLISVRDDGAGIPATRLATLRESIASRAFSPTEGGGFGLAIVGKIVADHGGTLTVDSELGLGTQCTIGLQAC